ncbi:MAG TPA: hypothetical protein V6D15_23600 [Oculatellaceae cyanobacterium]|jgi:hypothetical protein
MLQPIQSSDKLSTDPNPEELNKLELEADFNTTLIQNPQDNEGKTYSILDDATLIKKFVQGETKLLANQSLRIDSSFERIELTTRKGIIIGLYTLNSQPISVLIRSGSEYNELLYESLLENNFILIGKSNQKGFVEYQQYIPPTGYKVNCTPTVVLWRNWWMGERNAHKHQIQMEILISFKNKWYPISEISSNHGIFDIKTLVGELTLHSGEKIIWVSKLAENSNQTGEQNIVKPSSDLGIDTNSSEKFNTQQAASTRIQSSTTIIQNDNQANDYSKEQPNSDLEENNFNTKQAEQRIISNFSTSSINYNSPSKSYNHQSNSAKNNAHQTESFTSKTSTNQARQGFQNLDHSQLEDTLQSLKLKAIQALENYLVNGATETRTEDVRNGHGQIVNTKSITIKNNCPNWVIENVLQKNDLLQNYSDNSKNSQESSNCGDLDFPL